jgi:hypothetical protein
MEDRGTAISASYCTESARTPCLFCQEAAVSSVPFPTSYFVFIYIHGATFIFTSLWVIELSIDEIS